MDCQASLRTLKRLTGRTCGIESALHRGIRCQRQVPYEPEQRKGEVGGEWESW